MKVGRVSGVTGSYQPTGIGRAARAQDQGGRVKADGVTLSKEAQEVLALKERLVQTPEVRQGRVEELREQIRSGEYRPDGREVADKMLRARVFDELW